LRVLITGGAGFIGSALAERLLAESHRVDVVDDLSTGSLSNLSEARRASPRQLTFHQVDVGSPDLPELFSRCRPQVVYHLATTGLPADSVADPIGESQRLLVGPLRVLEAARGCGAGKLVFVSGGAVYGEARDLPAKEAPMQPISPFGVIQKAVADYLYAYRELYSLEFTVLVLSSVYGPRDRSGVIASFADRLLGGRPCTIYGDGGQSRDFLFVDDAVDALARAAERGGGLTLNVGTGIETTIAELYRTISALLGVDHPPLHAAPRPGEQTRISLDPGRARIHLGWKPWTELSDGLASYLESLRS
jgi:UDP-glucose 4-epimerase